MKKRYYNFTKKIRKADADRCICCGAIVPEGTWVCYACMHQYD